MGEGTSKNSSKSCVAASGVTGQPDLHHRHHFKSNKLKNYYEEQITFFLRVDRTLLWAGSCTSYIYAPWLVWFPRVLFCFNHWDTLKYVKYIE